MLPTLEEHSKKTTVVPARCGELNCPLGPTPRDETVFGRGSVLLWLDGATFVVCHPAQLHWGCPGVRLVATLVGHASNDHRECLGVNGSAVANPELTVALLSCGTRTCLSRQRGCTTTGSLSGLVAVSDKLSGSMSAMWTTGVALLANTHCVIAGPPSGWDDTLQIVIRLRCERTESVGDYSTRRTPGIEC